MPNKTIIAIIAIAILAGVAIFKDMNGVILSLAVAAIAGLGGYELGTHRKPKPPTE